MKTKYWIALFAILALICAGLSLYLFRPQSAAETAEIWSEGKLIQTVDLSQPQQFTVRSSQGSNTITVKDGAIAVTQATCPDHHCQARGFCSSGMPIVCLPNQLVIRFSAKGELDAVTGR